MNMQCVAGGLSGLGNASQCRSGGNAILAVLAVPDAGKTAA